MRMEDKRRGEIKRREAIMAIEMGVEYLNSALQPFMGSVLSSLAEEELIKLRSGLSDIQAALGKIETCGKPVKQEVNVWIEQVSLVADELNLMFQEWKSRMDGQVSNSSSSSSSSSSAPLSFNPLKIKETRKKLDVMLDMISSSSYLMDDESGWFCFGRDEEKENIIDLLLDLESNDDDGQLGLVPFVFSIVGIGGIGKTTLAQLVFDDKRVKNHFNLRVWEEVSDNFNVEGIGKSIIPIISQATKQQQEIQESITAAAEVEEEETALPPQSQLEQSFRGKRFLLVLDDVWSVDDDEWSRLKQVVRLSAMGSCIVVTTRNEKVATTKIMGEKSHFLHLKPLPVDDCWSLFGHKAFRERSRDKCLELVDIGSNILKRSGGVPLFVNTLGDIWSSQRTRRNLEFVSKSVMLDLLPFEYNIMLSSTFTLTYNCLPQHLKQCFHFCSLFPQNSWIEKEILIQMWMAQDFIRLQGGEEDKEVVGSRYFDDLLSLTSFFKDVERDDVDDSIVRCKMHGPAHDLASRFARNECLTLRKVQPLETNSTINHLSLVCAKDTTSVPDFIGERNTVRTLLLFGNPRCLNVSSSSNLFQSLGCLRILDLSSSGITGLPDSIGSLKDLRYLNLSSTNLSKLPESICNLKFLQTFKLSFSRLSELPKDTRRLISLRHLEIAGTCMNCLPKGIEKLTDLRKLSEFIVGGVGSKNACPIRELGYLNSLQGRLVISNLSGLANRRDAEKAKLNQKDHVNSLILDGRKHLNNQSLVQKNYVLSKVLEPHHIQTNKSKMSDEIKMQKVFEGLEPHVNLKKLEIWNYIGHKFPNWMEKPLLTSLVSLKLIKCGLVEHLPSLGELSSLKYLELHGMNGVRRLGHEFYGEGNVKGFPKLECLTFVEMTNWEEWNLRLEGGEMPCLRKLLLRHCHALFRLSDLPRALSELALHDCPGLKTLPTLPSTLRKLTLSNCIGFETPPSLPEALWVLMLRDCTLLMRLPDLPMTMRKLVLVNCHSLTTIQQMPEALRELEVCNCPNLKAVQCLPSTLRKLAVKSWPDLKTVPQVPDTLKALHICNCLNLSWNSSSFRCLENLTIASKERKLKSLPELPNLVSLKIMLSSELAVLPNGLSQLKKLKIFSLYFCPGLRLLPKELQELTNLKRLSIVGCPQIEQSIEKKGNDFHTIAHIPYIEIDNRIRYNWMPAPSFS